MKDVHNKNISMLKHYKYRLSNRERFNQYSHLRRIMQQYVVDAWTKIQGTRLYFVRKNQDILRTEIYRGVMDYISSKSEQKHSRLIEWSFYHQLFQEVLKI